VEDSLSLSNIFFIFSNIVYDLRQFLLLYSFL
jgi:hypothetical protein